MQHLGDITKLSGYTMPPVDCITFGSPCQDLSIAGLRAGLSGERSGLFLHAVRIIREMRDATHGKYPTYAVWENVPGAFSSGGKKDFAEVLQALCAVAGDTVPIPGPPRKWLNAGQIMGDGYSIAWRVYDAQYWGVPQRRRRIYLVADLGGQRAPKILFERPGLPGGDCQSAAAGQATTRAADGCAAIPDTLDGAMQCAGFAGDAGGRTGLSYALDSAPTLVTKQRVHMVCAAGFLPGQSKDAQSTGYQLDISPTLPAGGGGNSRPAIVCAATGQANAEKLVNLRPTLNCNHEQPIVYDCRSNSRPAVVYRKGARPHNKQEGQVWERAEISNTLTCNDTGESRANEIVISMTHRLRYLVRRLTPLECERLQGYPDGWTDIPEYIDDRGRTRKVTDSARYKALGNSVAIPCVHDVLSHMALYLPAGATLGSLFDGIGGFPLVWERLHGSGTAIWASEIEPYPQAVTEYHFGFMEVQ